MENNLKEIEDKFLSGCLLNNIASAKWFLNIPKILMEMDQITINDNISELFKKLTKEKDEIANLYKNAIANIEDINISDNNDYNYLEKRKEIEEKYINLKKEKNCNFNY